MSLEAARGRTDDDRPPICPVCGVTMVSAELSAHVARQRDWVCLECEERDEPELRGYSADD
jgi:tRNA(Ile2) C34 agmatinyltransferase TiaS